MADLKRLQRLIDASVKASNAFHTTQNAVNDFCRNTYGVEPGDVDADAIIDAVFGGCGLSTGMTAREFDETMRDLT
jgi:hypothetical protein